MAKKSMKERAMGKLSFPQDDTSTPAAGGGNPDEQKRTSIYGSFTVENRVIDGKPKMVFSASIDFSGKKEEFTDVDKFKAHLTSLVDKASKEL
jgi:hypothetical protein